MILKLRLLAVAMAAAVCLRVAMGLPVSVTTTESPASSAVGREQVLEGLSYLRKFGYLDDCPSSPADATYGATADCPPDRVASAVARFQALYQLTPPTRRLDAATLAAMRQGRCGVGDSADALRAEAADQLLPEAASPGTPAATTATEAAGRRLHRRSATRHQAANGGIRDRFQSPRITWRLAWRNRPRRLALPAVRALVRAAFRMWARVAPFEFAEASGAGQVADIEIGFFSGRHANCRHAFDGPGRETAHAYATGPVHIDDDEAFRLPAGFEGDGGAGGSGSTDEGSVDLLRVLVHEIGHSLGLRHSASRSSIMHPASVVDPPAPPPSPSRESDGQLLMGGQQQLGLPLQLMLPAHSQPQAAADGAATGRSRGSSTGRRQQLPVLIGSEESRLVQESYGHCSPRIDALVDWRLGVTRVFSCDAVWQTVDPADSDADARTTTTPTLGEADSVARRWPALGGVRVDALLRAPTPAAASAAILAAAAAGGVNESGSSNFSSSNSSDFLTLLFSGSKYYQLDSDTGHPLPGFPRNISDDFRPKPGQHYGLPDSMDAAYFDYASNRAVFIKGDWVFEYDIVTANASLQGNNCCEHRHKFAARFPVARGHRAPTAPLDAAYSRLNDSTVFLLSGDDFWRFEASAAGPKDEAAMAAASSALHVSNSSFSSTSVGGVAADTGGSRVLRYGGKVYSEWPNLCSPGISACTHGRRG